MRLAPENLAIGPARRETVGALRTRGRARFGRWSGQSVALASDDPLTLLEALLAAAEVGFELTVFPDEPDEAAATIVAAERAGRLHERPSGARNTLLPGTEGSVGGLTVLTSGSTGEPKRVRHPFERLDTFAGVTPEPARWLVTYQPGTYAWAQAVVLGLAVPGQDLVFPASLRPADLVAALVVEGVTAVSSTPTLWRYLLATSPRDELARAPLHQITLGGERVDQPILDQLAARFPGARLTHIFATAETGPAIVVDDGRAGFPASYLERPLLGGRVHVRLEAGTLHVRSPWAEGGSDGWVDTGDRAEVVGDRVHVLGRERHDTINVGGAKVRRGALEDFVRGLDGIVWARAFPARSALAGELVGLEVVLDPERRPDPDDAERAIVSACADRFPEHWLPRVVRFLDTVPLGPGLKTRV